MHGHVREETPRERSSNSDLCGREQKAGDGLEDEVLLLCPVIESESRQIIRRGNSQRIHMIL